MPNPHPDDVPASIIAEILEQVAGDESGHVTRSFPPSARRYTDAEYLAAVRLLQSRMLPTGRTA